MSTPEAPIRRSPGVLLAPFLDGAVAYDMVAEQAHVLNATAAWLLEFGDGLTVGELVDDVATVAGDRGEDVGQGVVAGIDHLRSLGLVDRSTPTPSPPPLVHGATDSNPTLLTGGVHPVVDRRIAFRSTDADLLARIDAFLGPTVEDLPADLHFEVGREGSAMVLRTADTWRFPSEDSFWFQLPGVVNEYAARSDGSVVLHAGAVLTPDQEPILIVGESNSGKSTLVAALLQAGCAYFGDEAIGIRDDLGLLGYPKPLTIDGASRELIGLDASDEAHATPSEIADGALALVRSTGPIDRIVFATHAAHEPTHLRHLHPTETLRRLLESTLNLGRAGAAGLRAIAAMAEAVPAVSIVHGNAIAVARSLVHGHDALGAAFRTAGSTTGLAGSAVVFGTHALDAVAPRRVEDAVAATIRADGAPLTLVRRPGHSTKVLDPVGTALWPLLDGARTVGELAGVARPHARDDADAWRLVVSELRSLSDHRLIDGPVAPWPSRAVTDAWPEPAGPWTALPSWTLCPVPVDDAPRSDPDRATDAHGFTARFRRADIEVLTDDPVLRATLEAADAVESAAGHAPSADPTSRLVVQSLNGAGALLRTDDGRVEWVRPEAVVASTAAFLAGRLSEDPDRPTGIVPPTWMLVDETGAALLVEDLSPAAAEDSAWVRPHGVRLDREGRLAVPDRDRASAWLSAGADPTSAHTTIDHIDLVTVGVAGTGRTLDAWVTLADSLTIDGPEPWLVELVSSIVDRPIVDTDGRSAADAITETLGRSSIVGRPSARTVDSFPAADLREWVAPLGSTRPAYESARVDRHRIVTGRPLVHVQLDREAMTGPDLVDAIAQLGLSPLEAGAAADVVGTGGELYVGEERGDGPWRRKLYVTGIDARAWARLAPTWPPELVQAHATPIWVAWKFADDGSATRTVEVASLGGAAASSEVVGPLLERGPQGWAAAVRELLASIGFDLDGSPRTTDLLTIQDDGRRSVDLDVLHREPTPRRRSDAQLRALAAAAGHGRGETEALVRWSRGGHLARLIFGLDGRGDPFANLYVEEAQR